MTEEKEREGEEREAATEGGRHDTGLTLREDGTAESEPESVELEELREELQMVNDRHLRLAAEFDNYRKRNERERQALAARLQLDLVSSLLEILDDLERVAGTAPEAGGSVLEGVRLVEKKFRSVLEAAGLEPVEAEGEPFDPEVMEALMTVPTDDPSEDDHVADVFQRGYRFRDVLVRPARVRVLKHDDGAGEVR